MCLIYVTNRLYNIYYSVHVPQSATHEEHIMKPCFIKLLMCAMYQRDITLSAQLELKTGIYKLWWLSISDFCVGGR